VAYGLERFDQYTYGTRVIVENDHKLLYSILHKPRRQAPKRLRALMMRIHRYDVEFRFLKGSELIIADTPSRAYLDTPDTKPSIMNISFFLNIADGRLEEVKNATENGATLLTLKSIILNGWPDSKHMVPSEVKVYFDFRDSLSYEDGIILKYEALLSLPHSGRT
jgi:hypothetical protein